MQNTSFRHKQGMEAFMITEKLISPLYDFAFAQIFGNQKNIDITKAFLKTLLDIPGADYNRLTVENSILRKFFRQDKMGIVDLKLSTKSGKIIHIELQVEKKAHLQNRILYYMARLVGDQLKWGEKYGKLHQVISIVICNHVLLDDEESYINQYELRNEKNRSFTNMLQLVILELPKLPQTADSGVWPWLRFLTCTTEEEYAMLVTTYPELEKPIFCVKKMSLLDHWREYLFHKNLWKEDERMRELYLKTEARTEGHTAGKAEGKAEGKTEGQAEKALEIARKMKAFGDSAEKIHTITGLPVETIENIL